MKQMSVSISSSWIWIDNNNNNNNNNNEIRIECKPLVYTRAWGTVQQKKDQEKEKKAGTVQQQ